MKRFSYSLLLLFWFVNAIGQNVVERIEPSNWWVDMEYRNVQVLLYGDDIAYFIPQIDSDRAELDRVIKVENPNYLFININIKENAHAGDIKIKLESKDGQVDEVIFELWERKYSDSDIIGFSPSDAIYLITPDRFANGDMENDEIAGMKEGINRTNPGGRHGGDIAGISSKLDYIKDMGFTAIWLNPVLENDMDDYSYHGYATTDFYKVDPRYGSNEEYQALAERARSQGLKLIMDMIVNHCGLRHWWMEDLPMKSWINHWDSYTETSHRKTLLQDPYAAPSDKKVFTDGWFVPTMPDLNQHNDLLGKYLIQNSIWWIEYLGLAGIRMDTYPYPDMDYMTRWTDAVMTEYPNFNIVGEEWYEDPSIVSYWQKGKSNPNGYQSELKSLMDFPLQAYLVKALNEEESWSSGLIKLYETLAKDFLYASADDMVTFPDNHDMSRIYTQLNEDFDLFKMALAFIATTRGTPQIYYGTEILMTNPGTTDHGVIRSDFPGGWQADPVNGFTSKALNEKQIEAQQYVRKLLRWRRQSNVIHEGDLVHFIPHDGCYVYFRYNDAGTVMVLMNKNENEISIGLDRFANFIGSSEKATDVITGKVYKLIETNIIVPSRTALILELH